MDLTATVFGIASVLGVLLLSKQVGGLLLILGVLRFTLQGNRGHYLILAGLAILLIGADLTATDSSPVDGSQSENNINHRHIQDEITNDGLFMSDGGFSIRIMLTKFHFQKQIP
ncbi:MAG: hypothetical protein ACXAEI_02125 [Candidatus Hodarchaeales archaeon]